jgi:hypothetical protein
MCKETLSAANKCGFQLNSCIVLLVSNVLCMAFRICCIHTSIVFTGWRVPRCTAFRSPVFAAVSAPADARGACVVVAVVTNRACGVGRLDSPFSFTSCWRANGLSPPTAKHF